MYRCPVCGRADRLAVVAKIWAALLIDEDGEFETETDTDDVPDNDHEFDSDSLMQCMACRHEALALEFDVDEEPWEGDGTSTCSVCGEQCSTKLAHLHDGALIGHECCWDDRLKGSE